MELKWEVIMGQMFESKKTAQRVMAPHNSPT